VSVVAVLAVAGIVAPSPVALGAVALGGASIGVGLRRLGTGWIATGAGLLLAAVVLAGPPGRSSGWFLAAAVPVALAWLNARYAVRLGRQVGPATSTLRIELVHAILTLAVLVAGGAVGYLVVRSVTGTGSVLSLGLLFVAVVVFIAALVRS
jgi:hypothetical protein